MKFFRKAARNLGIVGELFSFFWHNKRWWLAPMLAMLVLLAALIAFAQSSAISSLIYTLF